MCPIAGLPARIRESSHTLKTSANYHPTRRRRKRRALFRSCMRLPMRRPCVWPCLLGAVFGASLADRASMCPSGCNGRGFCDDATCVCYPG